MVAHQYFESAPPPYPPLEGEGNMSTAPGLAGNRSTSPPRRFRRDLLIAVAALTVASGAGSGAIAAALIDHGATTASAGTVLKTTATSTSSTSSLTATTVYAQDSPGVVMITVSLGNSQAIGSGIVLDTKGDILTNAHVISGARTIEVAFSDGTTAPATVVGSNAAADLAVIRVSVAPSTLHPLTLGSSVS